MVILQNSHSVQWRPYSPCPHVCDPGWVLLAHICNATNGHLPHQCPIFIVFLVYHERSVVDNSSTYLFTHSLTISCKQKFVTQSCLMAMIYIGSRFVLALINIDFWDFWPRGFYDILGTLKSFCWLYFALA